MKIGNVELKSNIILAPIAGFSDVGFRDLCAVYGAGLTVTEMVSAKGLCYCNKGTDALLAVTKNTKPVSVQLFGSDPEFMYKASKDERLSKFDIIDINMGCPVRKVFSNGDGSALMQNGELISEIVHAVKEGSGKPVTVKIRAGIVIEKPLAVQSAICAEKAGADAITVHPRYREQFYSGNADHTITYEVKKAVGIPVIASGDIVDLKSLQYVAKTSQADGFMIARGALGKPYIFSELQGLDYNFCVKDSILKHIETLKNALSVSVVANQMKLHLCYYAKNTSNSKLVRTAVSKAKTLADIYGIVEEYFV